MGIYGETTVQAMYALFGVDQERTTPALKAEVAHRASGLSRRGFLGLVGAATAGMMFAPDTGLWTPVPSAEAISLATTDLGLLARRFATAVDEVFGTWARYRPQVADAHDPSGPPPVRHILAGSRPAECDAYTDDNLRYIARGAKLGNTQAFNERFPLPILGMHSSPDLRVVEALSPEQHVMVRIVEWDAPADMFQRGTPVTRKVLDFEIAGYYTPRILAPNVKLRRERRRRGQFVYSFEQE